MTIEDAAVLISKLFDIPPQEQALRQHYLRVTLKQLKESK